MTDITIIMVTYNSAHIIAEALSAAPSRCPMIVVDNASSDDTCAVIKAHKRSGVRLIRNKENSGFGAANNIALRQCKTRYALLLNPDAMIKVEDLRKLQAALEANDKAVISGPLTLKGQKKTAKKKVKVKIYPMLHKNRPLLNRKFRFWVRRSIRIKDLSRAYECGFLGGAVMLYDLQKMPEIIYFDEDIFMYKDENELQYRIIEAGYKILLVPYARATHEGMASSKFADNKSKMWNRFYHTGRTEGVLARKYPHKVSKFSIAVYLLDLRISEAFHTIIRTTRALRYKAKRIGFIDGYGGKRNE